jgi:hypothetical protein
LDAQLALEELPARVVGANRGGTLARGEVGTDQEPVTALPEWIEADGLSCVTRGESRVAVGEPYLTETFQCAQPNIDQSQAEVVEPFALLAGKQ